MCLRLYQAGRHRDYVADVLLVFILGMVSFPFPPALSSSCLLSSLEKEDNFGDAYYCCHNFWELQGESNLPVVNGLGWPFRSILAARVNDLFISTHFSRSFPSPPSKKKEKEEKSCPPRGMASYFLCS
jgi:hypothetical protein